jgi:hypothetical protein
MPTPIVGHVPVKPGSPDWHYVVLTYLNQDGQEVAELYIDANPFTQKPPLNQKFDVRATQALRFGGGNPLFPLGPATATYDGVLDEVALYSSYLPAAEVIKHRNLR